MQPSGLEQYHLLFIPPESTAWWVLLLLLADLIAAGLTHRSYQLTPLFSKSFLWDKNLAIPSWCGRGTNKIMAGLPCKDRSTYTIQMGAVSIAANILLAQRK